MMKQVSHLLVLGVLMLGLTGCAAGSMSPPAPASLPAHPKATYVIVHGAWGGAWGFRQVGRLMEADGYRVYRPTLTGQGERFHLSSRDINLSTHINDIVNVILFEDLRDIILVGHSYGGMVVTGVADRIPDRIGHVVYVDAFVPENGECVNDIRGMSKAEPLKITVVDGFAIPTWVRANARLPHDVPMPEAAFKEPIVLKNQDAARKIPTTYILTVDPGKPADGDMFFPFHERAKASGWPTMVMEGDHNPHQSRPKQLVKYLEEAPMAK